jgi:indolepyruvate decarboxylase
MTDLNLGIFTANLDPGRCIYATSEALRISHHHFHDVLLSDFLQGLVAAGLKVPFRPLPPQPESGDGPFELKPDAPITIQRLITRLNQGLNESMVVIAEPGDALFASSDLVIHRQTEYVAPAYYTSMGFGVPAALGCMIARPDLRAVVLLGDGAFQMTGMELSTIVRRGLSPIVIVLDNQGYGTERLLHPGHWSFNDIQPWAYHRLPEVLGGGTGYDIRTEGEFDSALRSAWADNRAMSLLHVHLDQSDFSGALRRLAKRLGAKI